MDEECSRKNLPGGNPTPNFNEDIRSPMKHFIMDTLSVQDLKAKIEAGEAFTLVDLQDPHEFEHRHIPGAVNIPMSDKCDETCADVLKDKDATIIVYGEFDELGKGSQATDVLAAAGYTKLIRLTGGLMGWMEAGYAVEGGKAS